MEFEHINDLAYAQQPLPSQATHVDKYTYLLLSLTYALHNAGRFDREEGMRWKQDIATDHAARTADQADFAEKKQALKDWARGELGE